jgi:hypothetical protein
LPTAATPQLGAALGLARQLRGHIEALPGLHVQTAGRLLSALAALARDSAQLPALRKRTCHAPAIWKLSR